MPNPQQQRWLDSLAAPAAVASQIATGVPAALTLAQAIFESAWGERAPGNNCFGIKADAHGAGIQYVLTHEYIDDSWREMPLAFEAYTTLGDCFADHARLIQAGVYASAWEKYRASEKTSEDLDAYIAGVAEHYATDPDYRTLITAEAHSSSVVIAIANAMVAL